MDDNDLLGVDDLAERGGVSRRTIRYYVQEGLLPPPLGVGRGRHYDGSHLERLLEVKALQEAGRSLDEIRQLIAGSADGTTTGATHLAVPPPATDIPRSTWRRLTLAPGVELHVAQDVRVPSNARLEELIAWCRRHMATPRSHGGDR